GLYVQPSGSISFDVPNDGAYWIVVPVGPSGVGFLGDEDKFVSNGRNRIARIEDNGVLTVRLILAEGESRLHLYGFSVSRPEIRATRAAVENVIYDSQSKLFHFDVIARPGTSPSATGRSSAR